MAKDSPLKVSVVNGELVIRVGVNVLCSAIASGDSLHQYDEKSDEYLRSFAIKDPTGFAKDVAIQMEAEEENGATPITRLLDRMISDAVDEGSDAVEYDQSIAFGEFAKCEHAIRPHSTKGRK